MNFMIHDKKIKKYAILIIFLISLLLIAAYFKPILFISERYEWYVLFALKEFYFDKTKSENYVQKAINLKPTRPEAHELKLCLLLNRKNFYLADKEINYIISQNLNTSRTKLHYFLKGKKEFCQGDLESAKESFSEGIQKYPSYPLNYFGLGLVYLKKNDTKNALKKFDKGLIASDKDNIGLTLYSHELIQTLLYLGKGFAYEMEKKHTKAQQQFKIADKSPYQSRRGKRIFENQLC